MFLTGFFCADNCRSGSDGSFKNRMAANTSCKIHFLTLSDNTDAILLECNGKFGMVDSGEDNDYPNGSNPHYPSRPGITKGNGFEQDVIAYLQTVGVTKDNFEFYIGTHPHSDHIGSADEIIYAFHPNVFTLRLILIMM